MEVLVLSLEAGLWRYW
jgi:hypothetical protein